MYLDMLIRGNFLNYSILLLNFKEIEQYNVYARRFKSFFHVQQFLYRFY